MADASFKVKFEGDVAPLAASAEEAQTIVSRTVDKTVEKKLKEIAALKETIAKWKDYSSTVKRGSLEASIAADQLSRNFEKLRRATVGTSGAVDVFKDQVKDATGAMERGTIVADAYARSIEKVGDRAKRARLSGLGGIGAGALGAAGAVGGAATFGPALAGLGLGALGLASPLVGAGAVGMLAFKGGQLTKKLEPELKPLEKLLERLKTLALNDLVPAFSKALKTLDNPRLIKAMSIVVNDFAIALGKVANILAKYLTSKGFTTMMAEWARAASQILPTLVKLMIVFGDTMGKLVLAFMPLAKWFAQILLDGAKWLDRTVTMAQATGALTGVMKDAKTALTDLGKILKVFFQGLGVVIDALKTLWHWFRELVGQKASMIGMIVAVGAALTLTLGPTAAAIVGVIAAIGLIKDHWKSFKDDFIRILKESANGYINVFVNPIIKALDWLIHKWNSLFGSILHIGNIGLMSNFYTGNSKTQRGVAGAHTKSAAGAGQGAVVSLARSLGVGSGAVYGQTASWSPSRKVDCSDYVYQVFTRAGFKNFPGTSETQWHQNSGPNWTSQPVSVGNAQPGDVVFMVGSSEFKPPGHVGIVTSGHGAKARVMQYYQTGHQADTIELDQILDLMGIKRFFLIKSARGHSHGSTMPPAPTLPSNPTPLTAPKAAHHHHLTARQRAYARAQATIAALGAPVAHDQNRATVALAHAQSAMSSGNYEKALKFYEQYKRDEEAALKAEEREQKKLQQDIKHSTGSAKRAYERALTSVQRNIASTQAAIIRAGKDMATATADEAKKLKQKIANILTAIETAADAQFEAQIAPLQKELDALTAQATAANDAQAVADAQQALAQELLLGDVAGIKNAKKALDQAELQQKTDQLQAQIDKIKQNEQDFNTAIEAIIAKLTGTGTPSLTDAIGQLIGAMGSGANAIINLLQQYGLIPGDSGGGAGGSGGGGGGVGAPFGTGPVAGGGPIGGIINPRIPMMARGGIVRRPTFALIGEAGPEAVIPLGHGGAGGVTFNVTINGVVAADKQRFAREVASEMRRELLRVQNRNGSLGFIGPVGSARAG